MKWLAALRWSVAAIAKAWFAICEKGHFFGYSKLGLMRRGQFAPGKKRWPVLKASDRLQPASLRQKRKRVPTPPLLPSKIQLRTPISYLIVIFNLKIHRSDKIFY